MNKMIVDCDGALQERPIVRYESNYDLSTDKTMVLAERIPIPAMRDDEIMVRVIGKQYPSIIKGQLS